MRDSISNGGVLEDESLQLCGGLVTLDFDKFLVPKRSEQSGLSKMVDIVIQQRREPFYLLPIDNEKRISVVHITDI
jgi:hypothetical protein